MIEINFNTTDDDLARQMRSHPDDAIVEVARRFEARLSEGERLTAQLEELRNSQWDTECDECSRLYLENNNLRRRAHALADENEQLRNRITQLEMEKEHA